MNQMIDQSNLIPMEFYKALLTMIYSEFDEIVMADQYGVLSHVFSICKDKFMVEDKEMDAYETYQFKECTVFQTEALLEKLRRGKKISVIHEFAPGNRKLITGIPRFDCEGNLAGIVGICQNISQVSRLQDKITELEERLGCCKKEIFQKNPIMEGIFITRNQQMKNVLRLIRKTAATEANILLLGETGVGKSFFAKMIHRMSHNRQEPFIVINCGAIPEALIESELFGYETGAFTGAKKGGKKGFFEIAQKGTIFLDEISELQPHLQVKLLHVLQERAFFKIGGMKPIELQARIISASNKNLRELVCKGEFRADLFYRLNVIPVEIPSLKERREDLPQFIHFFLKKYNKKYGVFRKFSAEALDILLQYLWPGNIREMENVIERLVLTSDEELIDKDFPYLNELCVYGKAERNVFVSTLKEAVSAFEHDFIQRALLVYKTTRRTAEVLQVDQSTIVKKMQKFRRGINEKSDHE